MRGYEAASLEYSWFAAWMSHVLGTGATGAEMVIMMKAFFSARNQEIPSEVANLFPGIDPAHTRIRLIISGGQSGVDLTGNVWALANEVNTEVRAFPEFKPVLRGDQSIIRQFRRRDHDVRGDYTEKLRRRTVGNVIESDATLIISRGERTPKTPGSALTFTTAVGADKPLVYIDVDTGQMWGRIGSLTLTEARGIVNSARVLNVAGSRDIAPGVVIEFLDTLIYWE